ncbi:MAG: hypothetical protein KDA28_14495, partial [Phycisphaerales bacterium]|nr:hypothetical protein [Phycisphaerales bacterium]
NGGLVDIITNPGGVMDGAGSDYLRFEGPSAGGPYLFTGNDLNEGDLDLNLSANADLITDYFDGGGFADARTPWVFPTADPWDTFNSGRLSDIKGEPTYAWGINISQGTILMYCPENGRDNGFTDFGLPTGTLYGVTQGTPNDFRTGWGYSMMSGEHSRGRGYVYMSIGAAGLPSEYIMDVAPVWFPYHEGWTSGTITDSFPASWSMRTTYPDPDSGFDVMWPSQSPVLPRDASEVIALENNGFAQGTFDFSSTDLGHTPANAMLFIQSADDASNQLTIMNLIENGSTWEFLGRKDDGIDQDGTDTSEFASLGQGDFSFVVLPYDTPNLIGGSYNADGSANMTTGGLTVTRTGAGTYEVAISGVQGQDGMLMLQATGTAPGNASLPGRNFLSYEYDANNNVYVVESREVILGNPGNIYGEEYPLLDTPFYVAYISFSNPPVGPGLGGPCSDADLAEPFGTLDIFDLLEYLNRFDSGDAAADLNGDTVLDIFDVLVYLELFDAGC